MSYDSMARLADDKEFQARVETCCKEQALVFKDDGRYSIQALAVAIIQAPSNAQGVFELVCVSPDMRDVTNGSQVDDAVILAAVQANWPTYAEVAYPAPPEEPAP